MTRTKLINELEKNLNQKITAYLLECLEEEDETRFSEHSIAAIKETALKEKYYGAEAYYHHLERLAIRDWFQGLGMSVAFTYYDIANLMRNWGFYVNEDDEDDYYEKCDFYWDLLTYVVFMS